MRKRQIHRGLAGFLAVLMLLQGLSVPALAAPGRGKGSGKSPSKQTEVVRPGKPAKPEKPGKNDLPVRNEAPETYLVTFVNGTQTLVRLVVVGGENVALSMPADPVRDGYTFLGWNTDPNGEGDGFAATTAVNDNLTVYAQWEQNAPAQTEAPAVEEPVVEAPVVEAPAVTGPAAYAPIAPLADGYTLHDGIVAFTGKEGAETVKAKLAKALLDGYTEDMDLSGIEFEYYCKGKDWKGVWGNTAWGTVLNEFTSKANNGAFGTELTYTHPALINNENGDYQIRLAGTTAEVTVTKETAKATIDVKEGASVALVYNSDGSMKFDAIREAILEQVVASSTPELTTSNTTIEYYASATLLGVTYHSWMPLQGGKDVIDYPAISAGDQNIRITFKGDDQYTSVSKEVNVTFTERQEPTLGLPVTELPLTFKDATTIDYDAVRDAIRRAVSTEADLTLTAESTTIKYYAKATTGAVGDVGMAWMPLEGGTKDLLTYPTMPAGSQKIKVTFKGNDKYLSTSVEATINFTDRAEADFTLNAGIEVTLPYKEDGKTVDYADLYQQIFDKVVSQGEKHLTLENVTIKYYAAPKTNINDAGKQWMPLEGGFYKVPVLDFDVEFEAISKGPRTIQVSYAGDKDTMPTTKEVKITVAERPEAFTLKEGQSVNLVYNDDLTVDYQNLYQQIFDKVVSQGEKHLTLENVTIKYYAAPKTNINDAGKQWMPLEGGFYKVPVLGFDVEFEAISEGPRTIQVSYAGDKDTQPTTKKVGVTVTDERDARFTPVTKDTPYTADVVYSMDVVFNETETAQNIFKDVMGVDLDAALLTSGDVTIQYHATAVTGHVGSVGQEWMPLSGGTKGLLTYPAIPVGSQKVRISWKGTANTLGGQADVAVAMTGRAPVDYKLNEATEGGFNVTMVYTDAGTIDYEATAKNIYDAVVNTAETAPDNAASFATVKYNLDKSGTTDWDTSFNDLSFVDLTGAIVKFGEGTQYIRIYWNESDKTLATHTQQIKVNMTGRQNAVIAAKDPIAPVTLTVGEDLKTNYEQLKQDLYNAIVDAEETTGGISLDNVTFAYKAPWIPVEGVSAGEFGTRVMPLEGGVYTLAGVKYNYAPISAGTQEVTISWPGNAQYNATGLTVSVQIKDRTQVSFDVNDNAKASLVYKEVDGKLALDFDAIRAKIFEAVVNSTSNPVGLTVEDVTIQYNANRLSIEGWTEDWKDLEWTGSVGSLDLVKFGTGEQKIKISWDGSQEFLGGSVVVTVEMAERDTAPWTERTPNASVKLPLNDDLSVNYEQLYQDVFNAIVESSDVLTAENVTIEYLAPLTTGTITDYDKMWMPLEGGKIDIIGEAITAVYKPISEGEQKIRISWPGNVNYAPTTIERTLTITDRPGVKFNVVEQNLTQPCEVGMAFNPDMTYDYAQTAKNIFETVVTSTDPTLTADDVTVEWTTDGTGLAVGFHPLSEKITGISFDMTMPHFVRISWAGDKDYKGASVTAWVKMVDGRLESSVVLNDGTFTYAPDKEAMKRNIYGLIDWNASTLPEGVGIGDFTIEYEAMPVLDLSGLTQTQIQQLYSVLEKLSGGALKTFVPVEGKVVNISDLDPTGAILKPILDGLGLGDLKMLTYPKMGAGENQTVRVTFNGDNEYRPSAGTATVTVEKASVKVSVNSTNIRAGEAIPGSFITTNPVDDFDVYTIYAGITSNITTALYLNLPDSLDNSIVIKALDPIVKQITGKSFTEMMNNGITVGELRGLLRTQELLDVLNLFGIDTSSFEGILSAIDGLAGIVDGIRVGFGAPNNRAGLYTVIAVTDSPNYNTGVGMGFLLVRMNLSGVKLTWNQALPGYTISKADAQNFDFGATLSKDGDMTIDQSSVSYLYSGFTSKWRVYSSTTTPPREPGSYVMTVCLLGGNYMAAPITRSFRIK